MAGTSTTNGGGLCHRPDPRVLNHSRPLNATSTVPGTDVGAELCETVRKGRDVVERAGRLTAVELGFQDLTPDNTPRVRRQTGARGDHRMVSLAPR